ncbi:four helix bundle protein, partial [Vibrio navarrensis]
FLYIAKGSCGELVTQLLLAKEFGYFDDSEASELIALATRVSRMIASLIKYRAGVVKDNRGTYLIEQDLEEQRVLEEQRALGRAGSRESKTQDPEPRAQSPEPQKTQSNFISIGCKACLTKF